MFIYSDNFLQTRHQERNKCKDTQINSPLLVRQNDPITPCLILNALSVGPQLY